MSRQTRSFLRRVDETGYGGGDWGAPRTPGVDTGHVDSLMSGDFTSEIFVIPSFIIQHI